MPRYTLPLAAALVALATVPARAQTDTTRVPVDTVRVDTALAGPPPVVGSAHGPAEGDTVRIVSGAGRYTGTLLRVTPDTFVVRGVGRQDAVIRGDVTSMQRLNWA